jgi:molecular chaperone HtpG
VSSFRNHVFDIETISSYLSQVAPVSFNNINFSYGHIIDKYLRNNLSSYKSYDIFLNGNKILKPYQKNINTSAKRGGNDSIEDIRLFEIKGRNEESLAYGWYGCRKHLLGSIKRGERYSGVRVRVGNILIGDAHLLDRCFREERFNSYMIGEIHVDSSNLIPNSRRDDFVDNETKTLFYNAVEKEIGLPISKEIRLMSRINTNKPNIERVLTLQGNINHNKNSENTKTQVCQPNVFRQQDVLTKIKTICGDCPQCHSISNIITSIKSV